MKKLTTEEKAKAYDKAIEKMRDFYRDYDTVSRLIDVKEELANIFPELAESEDERIRKEIVRFIRMEVEDETVGNKWLAWLGKQGEQKPADKVEPKFKIGNWVVHDKTNFVFKVVSIGSNGYEVVNKGNYKKTISFDNDVNYHLWSIRDAKDGDVLRIRNLTFIFQKITNNNACHKDAVVAYCSYVDNNGSFGVCGPDCITDLETIIPATKERRALLFQKMKEAGYEWNAEKKELKKIEQKTAWSEEDKRKMNRIYSVLRQAADTHAFSTSCRLIGDADEISMEICRTE